MTQHFMYNPPINVGSEPYFGTAEGHMSSFSFDIFLSFASADSETARAIWNQLELNGLRVFWSTETLGDALGGSFLAALQEKLEKSQHFVLLWTKQARSSAWVQAEYEAFYVECYLKNPSNRRLVILPDGSEPTITLPLFLRSLQLAHTAQEVVYHLKIDEKSPRSTASSSKGNSAPPDEKGKAHSEQSRLLDLIYGVLSTTQARLRARFLLVERFLRWWSTTTLEARVMTGIALSFLGLFMLILCCVVVADLILPSISNG